MLSLQNISYKHPNKDLLFENINLTVSNHQKIALIGNNGIGKSTLLKLIASQLLPHKGQIVVDAKPYYIPQVFGQYNYQTIAQALQVEDKLNALKEILKGKIAERNYALLSDDWAIEERCKEALNHWQLNNLDLSQRMETLSGGQKMKVLLAEFEKPVGWKFFSLEIYLEKIFNRKIDLVTKNAIKEQIKESILQQVNYV